MIKRTLPSGSIINTALTAAVSLSPGCNIPYNLDTSIEISATIGNSNKTPVFS